MATQLQTAHKREKDVLNNAGSQCESQQLPDCPASPGERRERVVPCTSLAPRDALFCTGVKQAG